MTTIVTNDTSTQITRIVGALFGVAPGNYYLGLLNSLGSDVGATANALVANNFQTLSASQLAAQFVANLGLTGDLATQGAAFVTTQLNAAGAANYGKTLLNVANAYAALANDASSVYQAAAQTFDVKVTNALAYSQNTAHESTNLSVLAAGWTATVAPVTQTYTLTTGVDKFAGTVGNSVFNGTLGLSSTLNSFDSLSGNATGENTLNLSDSSGGATDILPVGVKLSNITTINLATAGNAGDVANVSALDVSGVSGLKTLNTESADKNGDLINAAKTTDVNATALASGAEVDGGNNVTVVAKGDVTVAGAAGAVSVTGTGAATVTGGTTVTVKTTAAGNGAIAIGAAAVLNAAGTAVKNTAVDPTGNVVVNESTTKSGETTYGNGAGTIFTNGSASVAVTGTAVNVITDVQTTLATGGANVGSAVGTSTLTSVTLDGSAAALVTITSDALNSLTVQDANDVNLFTGAVTVMNTNAHALALTVGQNQVSGNGVNNVAETVENAVVTDGTATSVSVATTGAIATNVTLDVAKATALTFTNGADTVLNVASTLTKVAKVTASGAGALNLGDLSAGKVTTVDASTATGGVKATVNEKTAVTGGAGNDTITLNGVLTKTSGGSISLGAGNDKLLAGVGASIGAGVTVDGGAGDNTISASLVNGVNADGIKGFDTLDLSGYGLGNGNTAFDTALLSTAVNALTVSSADTAGQAVLLNLAANVAITNTFNAAASAIELTHAGSATNSLTVNFADATKASTQAMTLTSTGDASVAVVSGGGTGTVNTLTLTETDNLLKTLTITGANAFTLGGLNTDSAAANTAATKVASALTTIDGSAATGVLNITAGADFLQADTFTTTTYTGLTIKGGIAGDTIVNNAKNGVIIEGATSSKLANTLTVTGSGATVNDVASAGADTITLAGANQTALLGSGKAVQVTVNDTAAPANVAHVTFGTGTATVTDALAYNVAATGISHATNGDVLVLSGTLSGNTISFAALANAAGDLGATANVNTALAAANAQTFDQAVLAGESAVADTVTWFTYGGNTYIENSGAAAGTADNIVIKLAGIVDLSKATVDGAHNLTFA